MQYFNANTLSDSILSLTADRPEPFSKRSLQVSKPRSKADFKGICEMYFAGFWKIHSFAVFLKTGAFRNKTYVILHRRCHDFPCYNVAVAQKRCYFWEY